MCDLNNAEKYLMKLRQKYPGIDTVFLDVLSHIRTPETAVSYEDLFFLFSYSTDLFYPPGMCKLRAREYLLSIPNIVTFTDEMGTARFYRLR